jgi:hypothetical protein
VERAEPRYEVPDDVEEQAHFTDSGMRPFEKDSVVRFRRRLYGSGCLCRNGGFGHSRSSHLKGKFPQPVRRGGRRLRLPSRRL